MLPASLLRAAPRHLLRERCFATKVAFVKKIYSDGSTCQKCDFVWKQIQKDNLTERIDRVIVADERDHASEGVVLARKHEVTRAPFFVVTDDAKPEEEKVYDVYFKLKKDVFDQESGEKEKNEEIIRGRGSTWAVVSSWVWLWESQVRCSSFCWTRRFGRARSTPAGAMPRCL
ncbi:unnamed protein product [Effrenium voratum]|nr:unnamed protein product [Effrenium voratum]